MNDPAEDVPEDVIDFLAINNWLVVSKHLLFSIIYGMSSFPSTNIFQDG